MALWLEVASTLRVFEERLIRGLLALVVAGTVSACGANSAEPARIAPGAPSATVTDPSLGTLNGVAIRESDLSLSTRRELLEAENDMQQRHMHKLWLAFEKEVSDRLMADEAKRRGASVEALRKTEVEDKTADPTDADIRAIYDRNAADIEVPFERAAPVIKRQMLQNASTERERAYVETLRENAQVKTTIPVPSLPRYTVDSGHAPSIGPADAKVTLVEFSDFQCPYCREAHRVIAELIKAYPNKLRVV
ncbi:MAG: thioredoxin domain-containing protein, partial [Clostridia bacterium]|nr:thioredoxin domain-containing protein [Deltaproteobacteria bacterium]